MKLNLQHLSNQFDLYAQQAEEGVANLPAVTFMSDHISYFTALRGQLYVEATRVALSRSEDRDTKLIAIEARLQQINEFITLT